MWSGDHWLGPVPELSQWQWCCQAPGLLSDHSHPPTLQSHCWWHKQCWPGEEDLQCSLSIVQIKRDELKMEVKITTVPEMLLWEGEWCTSGSSSTVQIPIMSYSTWESGHQLQAVDIRITPPPPKHIPPYLDFGRPAWDDLSIGQGGVEGEMGTAHIHTLHNKHSAINPLLCWYGGENMCRSWSVGEHGAGGKDREGRWEEREEEGRKKREGEEERKKREGRWEGERGGGEERR